jgi:hypothetical protein
MRLALDIGLAGLALGVQRVELEVEIMLARFAGIDRTAFGVLRRSPSLSLRPIAKRRMRRIGVLTLPSSSDGPAGLAASGLGRSSPIGGSRWRIGCVRRNRRLLVDPEAKEARSIPVRPGDGLGDGGEAGIGGLAPDKAIRDDRDGVPRALVFAHQYGVRLEAPRAISL